MKIDLKGVPCKPYRIWVCSVHIFLSAQILSLSIPNRSMILYYPAIFSAKAKVFIHDFQDFLFLVWDMDIDVSVVQGLRGPVQCMTIKFTTV